MVNDTSMTPITMMAVESICYRMRDADKREIYAIRPHDNAYRLAWECHSIVMAQGRGRIAWYRGRPTGFVAFTENWPGNWNVWMFGTDEFKSVVVPMVGWARREVKQILEHNSGHRCQCESIMGHDEAHKLLRALGAKPEGPPLLGWGKGGESFQRFVWLRDRDAAVSEPGFVRADKNDDVAERAA